MDVLTRQLATATALVIGAVVADMSAVSAARAVVLGAAVTVVVFAAGLQVARTSRRDRALEVIRGGHDELPLRSVARERARLERGRWSLARSIERLLADQARASRRRAPTRCRRIFDPTVITAVAGDLQELARMVRAPSGSVPALALTERLVTSGDSPLHRSDAEALRREIGRIRFLLAHGDRPTEPPSSPQPSINE